MLQNLHVIIDFITPSITFYTSITKNNGDIIGDIGT